MDGVFIARWFGLPWKQVVVVGYATEKCYLFRSHVTTIVLHAIADDEVGHLQHDVVACYLVECVLADLYVRSLEFHDDERLAFCVVEDGIGASLLAVLSKADFVSHACKWVTQVFHHPVSEVLAYPFFWCEHNPA